MKEVTSCTSVEQKVQAWEGYDQIKKFFVMPEVPIDFNKLSRDRLQYWDSYRHVYNESRLIQIDTHFPGDPTIQKATLLQVQNCHKQWAIKHGPRSLVPVVPPPVGSKGTVPEEPSRSFKQSIKEKAELAAKSAALDAARNKLAEMEQKIARLQKEKTQVSSKRTKQSDDDEMPAEDSKRKKTMLAPPAPSSAPTSYDLRPQRSVNSGSHVISSSSVFSSADSPYLAELRKKDIEISIKEKTARLLALEVEAAEQKAALKRVRDAESERQLKSDIDTAALAAEKREILHASKARSEYLHERDASIDYQRLTEDRAFHKESLRRQWHLEEREIDNRVKRDHFRDIMNMAGQTNEVTILQSLLAAQRGIPVPQPSPVPTQLISQQHTPHLGGWTNTPAPPNPQYTHSSTSSSSSFTPSWNQLQQQLNLQSATKSQHLHQHPDPHQHQHQPTVHEISTLPPPLPQNTQVEQEG